MTWTPTTQKAVKEALEKAIDKAESDVCKIAINAMQTIMEVDERYRARAYQKFDSRDIQKAFEPIRKALSLIRQEEEK